MSYATPRALWLLLVLGLSVGALGCDSADAGSARFDVRESVEQLHVTHAAPGAELVLVDSEGGFVQSGVADALGSLVFREVPPGSGYEVRTYDGLERSRPLTVMSVESSAPPRSFYEQQLLSPGFQYIATRDGTTLSAYVTLPGPIDEGPYPTVVSYSGYDPSRPGGAGLAGDLAAYCEVLPAACDLPNDPAAAVAALFGFATVNVNMRGTGCSGGAFDYFETLQLLDGYDVIETVAAQDWVLHHEVGMVGISYSGISQLFVAATRPPSLAAITPLSVIGDTMTTLLPGGIFNSGFAESWITSVLAGAEPYGQMWEQARVDAGDAVCAENQLLHGQRVDNAAQARLLHYYLPEVHDRWNPTAFADAIEVPVFLASAWQDEQTGPYFFTLLDRFTRAPAGRFMVYSGVHVDALQPEVLEEWSVFLELFVARRKPVDDAALRALSPYLFELVFGSSQLALEPSPWLDYPDYETTLEAWTAAPRLRALFEAGAETSGAELGAPKPTFERSFTAWPPPETAPLRLFFQPDGSLAEAPPVDPSAASTFRLDPEAGGRGILAPGGDIWALVPEYDWRQPAPGEAVVFTSEPLAEDLVMMGTASVDLWLDSPVDEADLEATLSEVRPDGEEMFVQAGVQRASLAAPGPGATETWPAPTLLEADAAPLVPGVWTPVRVGVPGFQHVFRAGSRVRVSIDTPGGSHAEWRFALAPFAGEVVYAVGHDASHPSSVALPVLEGVTAGAPLPPCPSVRGKPCRPYEPFANAVAN